MTAPARPTLREGLEALVAKWDAFEGQYSNATTQGQEIAYEHAAEELRALLASEPGPAADVLPALPPMCPECGHNSLDHGREEWICRCSTDADNAIVACPQTDCYCSWSAFPGDPVTAPKGGGG